MKIVAISDTHNQHTKLAIPACDVLLHAGDVSMRGNVSEIQDFLDWFSHLSQAKYKILCPGNHDIAFFNVYVRNYLPKPFDPKYFRQYIASLQDRNTFCLIDQQITIMDKVIYGLPWTGFYCDWAFNAIEPRNGTNSYEGGPRDCAPDKEHPLMSEVVSKVPDYTDILLTHGPPRYQTSDTALNGNKVGSTELLAHLDKMKHGSIVVCGHIHEGRGEYSYVNKNKDLIKIYNVATLDRSYTHVRPAVEIEV